MILDWFSPLPPAPSGIADYTGFILPYLSKVCESRGCEVNLWTDQETWSKSLERYSRVRRYNADKLPWTELNGDDRFAVYHIGNNGPLHSAIWFASQKHAGVTVVHDTRLIHFFGYVFNTILKDETGFLDQMELHHGPGARTYAEEFWSGGRSAEEVAARYPNFGPAISNTLLTVVHSEESQQILKDEGYNAVFLPFPYPAGDYSETPRDASPRVPPFRLVAAGYIGPNRRLDSVIRALGSYPRKHQFRLHVYGPVWDESYLNGLARTGDALDLLTFHGPMPSHVLDKHLRLADLAVNLRYPTMGEASMSQLQFWDHSLPTMVTPVGWYAYLPQDAVFHVRHDREIEDIHRCLDTFLDHPELMIEMGRKGRSVLESQHKPLAYVEALLSLFDRPRQLFENHAAIRLSERAGLAARNLQSPASQSTYADRLIDVIGSLTLTKSDGESWT